MKFKELLTSEFTEKVPFRDGTLEVTFTPDNIGQKDLRMLEGEAENPVVQADMLAKGIKSWGIEDVKPITETFMRDDFPPGLLLVLIERLGELISSAGKSQPKRKG